MHAKIPQRIREAERWTRRNFSFSLPHQLCNRHSGAHSRLLPRGSQPAGRRQHRRHDERPLPAGSPGASRTRNPQPRGSATFPSPCHACLCPRLTGDGQAATQPDSGGCGGQRGRRPRHTERLCHSTGAPGGGSGGEQSLRSGATAAEGRGAADSTAAEGRPAERPRPGGTARTLPPPGAHLLPSAPSRPPRRPPALTRRVGTPSSVGSPTRRSGGRRRTHARHPGGGAGRAGSCRLCGERLRVGCEATRNGLERLVMASS